ncbi:MAG TPA: YhjD/YihY/BrkB family envelope integrity protein [Steroidobacteraceae bacterium]|nr:YhjD/YihY/BrkB family envelope integrity protein [Steroidobacteraceae bacterium]
MIASAAQQGAGLRATVVSLAILAIGATSALAELKDGLDQIWNAPPERTQSFWYLLHKRLTAVGLILALGFLLLVSLVLSAVLTALARRFGGAIVTAALFNVGKYLIGFYLGNSAIASAYGAAGSIIVVLVWVCYSALIFFFGAEFTKVYAHQLGSRRKMKHPTVTPPTEM